MTAVIPKIALVPEEFRTCRAAELENCQEACFVSGEIHIVTPLESSVARAPRNLQSIYKKTAKHAESLLLDLVFLLGGDDETDVFFSSFFFSCLLRQIHMNRLYVCICVDYAYCSKHA